MDEQPKSIWKKSWRGTGSSLFFLLLLGLSALIVVAVIGKMCGIGFEAVPLAGACFGIGLLVWALFRLVRWLCCLRNIKRSLFGLACLATLIALFYAEENWRGKRAWDNFRREWEAKGERFDFKAFVPPPVPDEQNFAMTPVVASCYNYILSRDGKKIPYEKRDTNLVNRLMFDMGDADLPTNGLGYWVKGTLTDLRWRQEHYRELARTTNLFAVPAQPQSPAADVLLALSKFDGTVEELRQANQLPYSRFPLNYDTDYPAEILLPSLAAMKSSAQLLRLRAIAELQTGQTEKALADVTLGLRLTEANHSEPFLISHLVRMAMVDLMLQPIYEGLAARQWTDPELVALDEALAKINFLADYRLSMRGECASVCAITDYISKKSSFQRYKTLKDLGVDTTAENGTFWGQLKPTAMTTAWAAMPNGWFTQNKMVTARSTLDWALRPVIPEQQLLSPQAYQVVDRSQMSFFGGPTLPWNFMAKLFLPALGASVKKAGREQISVDLARTAIALERYRLARGEFPETLTALELQFSTKLPHDVIGGGPLKYRREANGTFTLYSIGWNERDDGGVTTYRNGGSAPDFETGDWVWRYPQK